MVCEIFKNLVYRILIEEAVQNSNRIKSQVFEVLAFYYVVYLLVLKLILLERFFQLAH